MKENRRRDDKQYYDSFGADYEIIFVSFLRGIMVEKRFF